MDQPGAVRQVAGDAIFIGDGSFAGRTGSNKNGCYCQQERGQCIAVFQFAAKHMRELYRLNGPMADARMLKGNQFTSVPCASTC
jgi:hypothetical protein